MQANVVDEAAAIKIIQAWYDQHCDGTWEHHLGLALETTDNPGWLLTFKELKTSQMKLAQVIGGLLRDYGAQVSTDGRMVRVFAPSLRYCLIAAAIVIGARE